MTESTLLVYWHDDEFGDHTAGGNCICSSEQSATETRRALEREGWTVSVRKLPSDWMKGQGRHD